MKKACVSSQSAPGVFPWPPEKQKTKKNSQETRGVVLDIIKHLKKIQHLTPPRPKEFCKYQTCADPIFSWATVNRNAVFLFCNAQRYAPAQVEGFTLCIVPHPGRAWRVLILLELTLEEDADNTLCLHGVI